jgi:hypothetical protein
VRWAHPIVWYGKIKPILRQPVPVPVPVHRGGGKCPMRRAWPAADIARDCRSVALGQGEPGREGASRACASSLIVDCCRSRTVARA